MGSAAYNRGSDLIARQIRGFDLRPDRPFKSRPKDWGQKTAERALARARRLVRGANGYGRAQLPVADLGEVVAILANCKPDTGYRAAQVALAELNAGILE